MHIFVEDDHAELWVVLVLRNASLAKRTASPTASVVKWLWAHSCTRCSTVQPDASRSRTVATSSPSLPKKINPSQIRPHFHTATAFWDVTRLNVNAFSFHLLLSYLELPQKDPGCVIKHEQPVSREFDPFQACPEPRRRTDSLTLPGPC